jgi:stearoyl-CoA desaturase (Delta-9 desaturase)
VSPFPDVGAPPRPRADRVLQLAVTWLLVAVLLAGLAIGGTWYAAFTTLIWAGLLRVGLLQHVT